MMIQEFDDMVSFDPAAKPVGYTLIIDDEQRLVRMGPDRWAHHEAGEPVRIYDDAGAESMIEYLFELESQYPVNWMEEIK